MPSIPGSLYSTVYIYLMALLCLATSFPLLTEETPIYEKDNRKFFVFSFLLVVLITAFFAIRPLTREMGDTFYYVHSFNLLEDYTPFSFSEEWLWNNLNIFCKGSGMNYSGFFTVVAAIYLGGMFILCWKTMQNNIWIAILFCIASFSFYGYGINGIRNGMACSILLAAMPIFMEQINWKYIFGFILLFIAYGIHRTTLLPSICLITATFVLKNPPTAIKFWLASIVISLIAGNFIGDYLASTGLFEEKMGYFNDAELGTNAEQFSSTGFRWDFLIYSAMPVLMTWYVTMKRDFHDRAFNILATTYILANAFWIMVIRAEYSNRFAYLSWFLYPIVIAYPLLRMKLWEDQNRKTAFILLAYAGFTFIMFI